jgi:hypothetical protein
LISPLTLIDQRREALRSLADSIIGPTARGYLRPWMCADDPAQSMVFIVGANAATEFPADRVDRTEYLEALVEAGPRLRIMYDRFRDGRPSPTRINIERITATLSGHGAGPVLETNVWALPTRSLRELHQRDSSLRDASSTIFPDLLRIFDPRAVIVHGVEATKLAADAIGRDLRPAEPTDPVLCFEGDPVVFTLPSLSPPRANEWLQKSGSAIERLASEVGAILGSRL